MFDQPQGRKIAFLMANEGVEQRSGHAAARS